MATSTARIEANRRNAARSTGPKTAEGKERSRLNAFQHGMAGQGDLLAPGEDGQLVAARAAAFARELGAVGATGQVLAHRAALLSVRMEALARDEIVAGHAAERDARAEFDADRVALIDEAIAAAEVAGADPTEVLAELSTCPDGLAALLAAWRRWMVQLRSAEPAVAAEVVARWLGLDAADAAALPHVELVRRGDAELIRLGGVAATMGPLTRALEQARGDAGRIARLNPAPELIRARRYEAAAERGMFRAIRAIAELNRERGQVALAPGLPAAAPVAPLGPIDLDTPLASFRATAIDPLASFRAGAASVMPGAAARPVRSTIVDSMSGGGRPSAPNPRPVAANRR